MHKNLHSPTKLTEFARDWEDEDETIIGKLVTKITNVYNTGYNTVNVAPQSTASSSVRQQPKPGTSSGGPTPTANPPPAPPSSADNQSITSQSSHSIRSIEIASVASVDTLPSIEHVNANDTRTPSSIMTRISSLVAMKNNNLTNYKDTDLQKFWMPDSKSKECYECCHKFSTFRRKHHCRLCGQIFCSKCCSQVVPGRIIKCTGTLKVCTYCSKVVLSYLKSSDVISELTSDLQALHDDLTSKLSDGVSDSVGVDYSLNSPVRSRKVSVGYQEERLTTYSQSSISNADRRSILQQSQSLKTLFDEMLAQLPVQNKGGDLVRFLIANQKASNETQSVTILLAMIEAGFVVSLLPDNGELEFNEDQLYRMAHSGDLMSGSTSSFQLDLNVDSSSAFMSRNMADEKSSQSGELTDGDLDRHLMPLKDFDLHNSLLSTVGSKPLLESYCFHEEQLLNQLLHSEGLDRKWALVLIPLCARLANLVTPHFDGMDIRAVANFKKVPGGDRKESTIIGGVVISKNVAHKDMAVFIQKPRILLLQCAIVHQRREGKFASLDNLMMQEEEHLKNVTERIACLQPHVVLVHKNVARIAQDMLRNRGITLVLDVKLSVLERLARTLDCDIMTNIDSNIGRPRLGTCDTFRIRRYIGEMGDDPKTLMCFEVGATPKNHCVLLRGGSDVELAKVKRVASFLTYARYNWRFELSFLLDLFAMPPLPKEDAFESLNNEASPEAKEAGDRTVTKQLLRSERRSEDSRNLNIENVKDFSDPLRNTDAAPSVFDDEASVALEVETLYDNKFKAALSTSLLSISPFMGFPLPYLETESGRKCAMRRRFPKDLYFSKHWAAKASVERIKSVNNIEKEKNAIEVQKIIKEPHPFTTYKITSSMGDNKDLQSLWARYRACGGQFPKKESMVKQQKKTPSPVRTMPCPEEPAEKLDVLDIENHQKLCLLFCSYYNSPKETSSINQKLAFCTQPLHLDMHFYGTNDIMLGSFLERYCFRTSYICKFCNLPMVDHVRRYVHSTGCVQVYLTEEPRRLPPNTIFVATHCDTCQESSPAVPLSADSKCLSLAKYLEMRFHCHAYTRRKINIDGPMPEATKCMTGPGESDRGCTHSMHRELVHSFSLNGIVANFQYCPIYPWEIRLPDLICCLPRDQLNENTKALQEEVKHLSQNGYEVFAKINERLAQYSTEVENPFITSLKAALTTDQLIFKSRVEVVHTLLTDQIGSVKEVTDAMVLAKRALAESVESWGPRLQETAQQYKMMLKNESQTGESQKDGAEEQSDTGEPDDRGKYDSDDGILEASPSAPSKTGKKGSEERKTVKSIWNQLVSSSGNMNMIQSPIPQNEHHTLPLGAFPVTVDDQDLSSIVAHTLVSFDYKKALEGLVGEGGSSPHMKRKSHEGSLGDEEEKERDQSKTSGEEKEKKPKHNCHAEVNYHDSSTNFTCKIYFAREFEAMRRICLKLNDDNEVIKRKASANSLSPKILDKEGKISLDSWKAPEAEDIRKAFARSLSKSVPWDAKGGKSGSRFSKTTDKRFILKEMSKTDVTIFENFAPNYFDYVNESLNTDQPTLLAKIFGVFKLTIKKRDSSEEKNVLVMENLFFDRNVANKFDLKGSERNRLADPINQRGEIVLLDQNLLQMAWSNPLYIQSHSSKVLRDAIDRDASFLEKNEVMDYSLLVGLDSEEKLLVLGIIDYIRTFTFDKKLESLVKQTGILGGQGKLPTIISPKMYKQRFSVAMERYFMVVPDRWEGLSKM